jgi:hypothetical protein
MLSMRYLKGMLFTVYILSLASCLSSRVTQVDFMKSSDCKGKHAAYEYTSYFPFKLNRPFYQSTADELEFAAFLVLADSTLSIKLQQVQPYLLKNGDTVKLKEIQQFSRYNYPGIINEPEVYIHLNYTVQKKAGGSIQEINEDIKLYRCSNTFRSVH